MTQELLLDAMKEDLKELLRHRRLKDSAGTEREIQVYAQYLPVTESDEETDEPGAHPEPYVVVRVHGGKTDDDDAPQIIDAVLVVCVCDEAIDRQGHRDAMHLINEIYHHYSANAVIGGKWEILYPMEWAMQEDDTHPFYFAAMHLKIQAPAVHKEVPCT